MSMRWQLLLSKKRLWHTSTDTTQQRSAFQRDFDRIIFSSALRRMQDKTQVFPLSKIDYVRTRLTHSLESSSVGRSLGTLIGEQIIQRHQLKAYYASDFGDICAAACLAHDIGNPPFGHLGENAIRDWAKYKPIGQQHIEKLTPSEQADFLHFEGNAQGFRVLTRLQNPDNKGGLQLTCATLASFTKYPREAHLGSLKLTGVSTKKQGFTLQDKPSFEWVAKEVGLLRRDKPQAVWSRHPLAFLVEAADDICYHIIDIEDGFRLGCLSLEEVESLFLANLNNPQQYTQKLQQIKGKKEKVEFLRAKVINETVKHVVDCFLDNENAILKGQFDQPLMSQLPNHQALDALIQVANQKIYNRSEVLEIDAVGFRIISELLDQFVFALDDVAEKGQQSQALSQIICQMLPRQFIGDNAMMPEENAYLRLLKLTDFIAGMTDSYALSLYKKLTGMSL